MVTRFRIEGEGRSKQDLIEYLTEQVSCIIGSLDQPTNGEWECTDDVVTKSGNGYKGRMVLKFNRAQA